MLVTPGKARRRRERHGAGFTLIELIVVVAMVAVLAALAAPSLRNFAANQALAGVTSDLMAASMTARSTAINRNQRVLIEPMSGTDWTSGWRVYVDKDASSDFDATKDEEIIVGQPVPDTVAINSATITNCSPRDKFGYAPDGFLYRDGATFQNGGVPFISSVTSRDRCIVFDAAGRTRICGTGAETC